MINIILGQPIIFDSLLNIYVKIGKPSPDGSYLVISLRAGVWCNYTNVEVSFDTSMYNKQDHFLRYEISIILNFAFIK